MKKFFLTICVLFILFPYATANDCFDRYMNFATSALRDTSDKTHTEATITLRDAIQSCNLTTEKRLQILNRLDSIYSAINQNDRELRKKAELAKVVADSLKLEADFARDDAIKNQILFQKEALNSEARRLAFLSDRDTNKWLKLKLAYRAKLYMDSSETVLSDVISTFGDAVRDSFLVKRKPLGGLIFDLVAKENTILLAKGKKFGEYSSALDFYVAAHTDAIQSMELVNNKIITISKDQTAKIWNLERQLLQTLDQHQGKINFVKSSPSNNLFLSGSNDKTAKIWQSDGTSAINLPHSDRVVGGAIAPNGHRMITRSADNMIQLWDTQGNNLKTLSFNHYVYDAVFLDQGNIFLTADAKGHINKYDKNGNQLGRYKEEDQPAIFLKKAKDDQHFLAVFANGTGILGQANSHENIKLKIESDNHEQGKDQRIPIHCALFSPTKNELIIQSTNKIQVIDFKGHIKKTFDRPFTITSLKISNDGKFILTIDTDNSLKIFDTDDNLLLSFKEKIDPIIEAQFYHNNEKIVAYTKSGKLITCLMPHYFYKKMQADPPVFSNEEKDLFKLNRSVSLNASIN